MFSTANPLPRSAPFGNGKAFRYGCKAGGAACLAATEGTPYPVAVCGCRKRSPSYEKKKNVRSLMIGPPSTPPKSFCRSAGRVWFANQLFASSLSFRK